MHFQRGHVERKCRVAQQGVLQFVFCFVLSGGDEIVLGQSLCFAHSDGFAVLVFAEHIGHVGKVHGLVVIGIHGAGGAEEGYGSSIGIEEGCIANVGNVSIEGHNVARGSNPER